jgi:hypothetical protein
MLVFDQAWPDHCLLHVTWLLSGVCGLSEFETSDVPSNEDLCSKHFVVPCLTVEGDEYGLRCLGWRCCFFPLCPFCVIVDHTGVLESWWIGVSDIRRNDSRSWNGWQSSHCWDSWRSWRSYGIGCCFGNVGLVSPAIASSYWDGGWTLICHGWLNGLDS